MQVQHTPFTTAENLTKFSTESYNSLQPVEDADKLLHKTADINAFVTEAKILAKKFGITDFFGVRLAHRHFELKNNECMSDQYETIEGRKALVTQPVNQASGAVPSSWILGKSNQYEVFEYSTDKKVKECYQKIEKNTELFDSFYSLAKKHNIEKIACPAILDREWHKDFENQDFVYFLENSYAKPSARSVVTAESKEFYETNGKPIITAWPLKEQPITHACTQVFGCQDSGGSMGHARVLMRHD